MSAHRGFTIWKLRSRDPRIRRTGGRERRLPSLRAARLFGLDEEVVETVARWIRQLR
jgi:hypothetical protein